MKGSYYKYRKQKTPYGAQTCTSSKTTNSILFVLPYFNSAAVSYKWNKTIGKKLEKRV